MENKEKKMLTTEDLNRTLGKKELYSIAFGHVIGSGVFSLIGIGIGYTGKSAWIGILLSAVFILLQALPFIVMAGTARFRGGYYSMMAPCGVPSSPASTSSSSLPPTSPWPCTPSASPSISRACCRRCPLSPWRWPA